jgi:alkyl hydroperoxide reductase subunit F
MKRDPVCNMDVEERDAVTTECDGVVYFFCSEGCRDKFLRERACKVPRTSYDLIISGGGPAGLTAAIYAATLKMDALLITKDLGGQAIDSTKIENYMGFDFITGPELVEKFRRQLVLSQYIDHLMSEVEKIEPSDGCFHVITTELKTYSSNALLIATGMTRRNLTFRAKKSFSGGSVLRKHSGPLLCKANRSRFSVVVTQRCRWSRTWQTLPATFISYQIRDLQQIL